MWFERNARVKSYDENIEEKKVSTVKILEIDKVKETTITKSKSTK